MLKKKTYIHLSAASLKIYGQRYDLLAEVSLPQGLIEHQEITNSDLYHSLIDSLLRKSPHLEFILLISDEFIYKKDLAVSPGVSLKEKKRDFLNMLPFDETKLAHKHVATKNGSTLIAVNKDLYEPILSVADKTRKKIHQVIPSSAKNHSQELSLMHDFNSAEHGIPWIDPHSKFNWDEEPANENPFNKRLVSLLSVFTICLIALIFIIFSQINAKPAVVMNNTVSRAPVLAPAASPTPTAVPYKQLSELKVEILNASSAAGQAGRLEKRLAGLGMNGIEIGNEENQELNNILMLLTNKVSASDSALLTSEILSTLPGLTVNSVATDTAEFDIQIIIGKKSVLE